MPFKKELLVKSEQKLGGKDAKKLIAEAQQRLGDDAKELLKGDLKQRKSAGGVVCRIICNEGLPMLFELGNSGLLPTLPALWKAPSALPALFIPPEAARFLLNGADLLLPGVRGCDATVPDLPAGTPACVRIMGNPAAVAVGVLAVDGAAIAMAVAEPCEHKGVALTVEHIVGDALWRHCERPLPNSGFTAEANGSITVAPIMAAPSDDNGVDQMAVALSQAAVDVSDALHEDTAVSSAPSPSAEPAEVSAASDTTAAMDDLMRKTFLQTARKTPDAALPLGINVFYSQHLRPNRPAGSSLDVKLSSHKKLGNFMSAMESAGSCTLTKPGPKEKNAEVCIKSFDRNTTEYLEFEEWQDTEGGSSGGGGGGGGAGSSALVVKKVYRPIEAMRPLFVVNGKGDAKAYFDEHEALSVLEAHAKAANLCSEGNSKVWVLDPLLADALYKGGGGGNEAVPTELSAHEVRKRFLKRLDTWTRVSGGALEKAVHSKGEPPKVILATEQRRGHHVTTVAELSSYSIDPYSAARELQSVCGATANVEEEQLKSGAVKRVVTVQGLWDRSIGEWLGSKHGLPEVCIENRAAAKGAGHTQKKDKKATNVRKA